jgi:hypothetical protein
MIIPPFLLLANYRPGDVRRAGTLSFPMIVLAGGNEANSRLSRDRAP